MQSRGGARVAAGQPIGAWKAAAALAVVTSDSAHPAPELGPRLLDILRHLQEFSPGLKLLYF